MYKQKFGEARVAAIIPHMTVGFLGGRSFLRQGVFASRRGASWSAPQQGGGGFFSGEEGSCPCVLHTSTPHAQKTTKTHPTQSTFAAEGLPPYRVEGLTGSTRNSHRLLLWAAEAHGLEAQNRLVDRLFEVRGRLRPGKHLVETGCLR
jgi:hypothetical protein